MQFSFYKPDEVQSGHQYNVASTLQGDYKFASAAVDDKAHKLAEKTMHQAESGMPAAHDQTVLDRVHAAALSRPRMMVVWVLEFFALAFQVVCISVEFISSCSIDFGLPQCSFCYSSAFLTWNMAWVALWFVNLYTFLLLISRGFVMSGNMKALRDNFVNLGIPRQGVMFFLAQSATLIFWLVIGICVLISSNSCMMGGRIFQSNPRSGTMFWSTLITIMVFPPLFALGRFSKASADAAPPPPVYYGSADQRRY